MLAYRLVKIIEQHSSQLAEGLLRKLQSCDKTDLYYRIPPEDFCGAVAGIYGHLGQWLMGKSEEEIAHRYMEIGERRCRQGVPLHQLIYAIVLTRDHLWEFLKCEDKLEKPAEIFSELEILEMLERFFSYATYYAAVGYEQAQSQKATAAEVLHAH